jgi:methionyl-tRNA formyltransferase
VKIAAETLGLTVVTPVKLRPFALDVAAWQPDAFVVASYGRIVPQVLLDTVPIAFNLHPSLLPLYRGATPLQSVIRDGRTRTGITIIAMDAGMDTGDVLLQESTAIGAAETYGDLHDRLAKRGAEMLLDALAGYERDDLPRTPQDRIAQREAITPAEIAGTATRPLGADDLRIDWHAPRGRVLDTVRAFAPQPLARTWLDDEGPLKIAAARAVDDASEDDELPTAPGPFVREGRAPWFGGRCGDGALVSIERVIAPGRAAADGAAFARSRLDRTARETIVP